MEPITEIRERLVTTRNAHAAVIHAPGARDWAFPRARPTRATRVSDRRPCHARACARLLLASHNGHRTVVRLLLQGNASVDS